jgi:ElaB/YqjD/DUF883 family membrane-anchored ribosome-binding protein
MDQRPDLDDRSTEEIERDIAAARESLSETVDTIEQRLHEATDWRTYVNRYPWVAMAAAAGLGLLLGHLLAGRLSGVRRPRHPYPPGPEA